jgi:hypothetical protein
LKLISDGGDSGSKKMQTRVWWRLRWGLAESAFGGSLESGGRFSVGAFVRNLASVAVRCLNSVFS